MVPLIITLSQWEFVVTIMVIFFSAPFAIFSIFILPFDINVIFYCGDTRKFGHSTFARSLIFKFEISAILKFYCSKF